MQVANDSTTKQRAYYKQNAEAYEEGWTDTRMDLMLPYAVLTGFIDMLGIESILDIGSGSGRGLRTIRRLRPGLRMVGIEPSPDLRRMGHRAGLESDVLVDGDATAIDFADSSFDMVCESGALHHISEPEKAVREMCRVASKAVFISDVNNFGSGSPAGRMAKQWINSIGLWRWADRIRTRGRGYHESAGDGVFYSYSVYNDLPLLEELCRSVHVFNIDGSARDPFRRSPHVALIGILTDQVAKVMGERV
jgi:ubiquinone/menaquinone biosynthesis C-methylase UbiE